MRRFGRACVSLLESAALDEVCYPWGIDRAEPVAVPGDLALEMQREHTFLISPTRSVSFLPGHYTVLFVRCCFSGIFVMTDLVSSSSSAEPISVLGVYIAALALQHID